MDTLPRRAHSPLPFMAVALLLLGGACDSSQSPIEVSQPDIVLITLDTMRADRLSCYGYQHETSPELDRLAEEGALFTNAYAVMPTTAPAHSTIMTSHDPTIHGVLSNGFPLDESAQTLAELLKNRGYQTSAFLSSWVLNRKHGLAQGFEHYDDKFSKDPRNPSKELERRAGPTTDQAIAWLKKRDRSRPLFLWLHYFDPHAPYDAPEPYRLQFVQEISQDPRVMMPQLYDGEVRYMDAHIGRLFEALEASRPPQERVTMVIGDHGEGLFDHGWVEHGVYLYEEAVRIPFIVHAPGRIPPGQRIDALAGQTDVFPTLLSLIDEDPGDLALSGVDLTGTWKGETELTDDRFFFMQRRHFESERVGNLRVKGSKWGVRFSDWKYIVADEEKTEELFDLTEDPKELQNVAKRHPKVVSSFEERVKLLRDQLEGLAGKGLHTLSAEDTKALMELGYVK